jgi:(p)ppGpp synthase/HD superfamily hydrolase
MSLLSRATCIAQTAHHGVMRKYYNIPYISHPLEVCKCLCLWGIICEKILSVAILHDTIEDASTRDMELWITEEITALDEPDILEWVENLTHRPHLENKDDYVSKFATYQVEPLIVKLADRCCNLLDFYNENPYGYFRKYYRKTTGLFLIYENRKQEMVKVFGLETCGRIDKSINNLARIYAETT